MSWNFSKIKTFRSKIYMKFLTEQNFVIPDCCLGLFYLVNPRNSDEICSIRNLLVLQLCDNRHSFSFKLCRLCLKASLDILYIALLSNQINLCVYPRTIVSRISTLDFYDVFLLHPLVSPFRLRGCVFLFPFTDPGHWREARLGAFLQDSCAVWKMVGTGLSTVWPRARCDLRGVNLTLRSVEDIRICWINRTE